VGAEAAAGGSGGYGKASAGAERKGEAQERKER